MFTCSDSLDIAVMLRAVTVKKKKKETQTRITVHRADSRGCHNTTHLHETAAQTDMSHRGEHITGTTEAGVIVHYQVIMLSM